MFWFTVWLIMKIFCCYALTPPYPILLSKKQIISFFKEAHFNSGVRLLLELYCVILMKDFTSAKLTMAFTLTSLPLNLYTSVPECGCGFGFEQKY